MKPTKSLFTTLLIISAIAFAQFALPQPVHAACSGTVYVDADSTASTPDGCSWANAFPTLQDALAIVTSGDEIRVAEGIYVPGDLRTSTFSLVADVSIYGGYAGIGAADPDLRNPDPATNSTVLSGEIGTGDPDDNVYSVVTITGFLTDTYILDGFTITAGNSDGSSGNGGGLFISNTSPTLTNLIISNNNAISNGGGIFINSTGVTTRDNYSSPVLTDVTISNNTAARGGGVYVVNGNPSFTRVIFSGNSATNGSGGGGGGMNIQTLNATDEYNIPSFTDITFSGNIANGGGGLLVINSNADIHRVTFVNNTAYRRGGGMLIEYANPTITNVTFNGNTSTETMGAAPWGGGAIMVIDGSNPVINNATFSGNNSTTIGGDAMRSATSSNPVITNSILWGDTDDEITSDGSGSITISDSVVQGGFAGGTNIITTDPLISALANNGGNTQTMAISTAGSAYNEGGVNAACAGTDQRGISRPQGAACDIGAFEIEATITTITSATPDPSLVGGAVTVNFTVTAGSGTPTGNVTVTDSASAASCTASIGTGSCDITFTTAGARTLMATYAGDTNFAGSSDTEAHTVNKASTTTTITSALPDPSLVGEAVTVNFTVTSASGTPTGDVTVTDSASAASCTASIGIGTCNITLNTVEARTLTAIYAGDTNFTGSSDTEAHTVNKASTTTTITSATPDPSLVGGAVTVTFTVTSASGTPTGDVTVTDSASAASCTAAISVGTCDITFSTAGARTLTATYAGDTNFTGSSDTEEHTVNKASTTTTITSDSPDPSVVGQAVTVNFTVTSGGGTPTGDVTVTDSASAASCTASIATGACDITFSTDGARTLTATYAGETNFAGSSDTEAHTVNKASTTTTITSALPDPSVVGQAVTVNFTVTSGGGTPTGDVTVTDSASAESCTASVGTGTCDITLSTAGARTLTATYAGDTNFTGSSDTEGHTVDKASTTTTITNALPDPSGLGQAVTVDFTVTSGGGTPTGDVTVTDSASTASCTASIVTGTCDITLNTAGARTLTATYAGDTNFTGSSDTEGHTVNNTSTTTTITSALPDPSVVGQAVTVNFTVTSGGGTPTGDVTVTDSASAASCTASVGTGTCDITLSTAGARTLTAAYAGDATFAGSSDTEGHTVDKASTTTTITSDSPDPSVVGQAVTVNFTVTSGGGTPTGNVMVTDSASAASCTASVGTGTCDITFTTAGARTLTATYAGDTNFTGSSDTEGHTVNKANTTTTITSDLPDPSVVGQAVTVNFMVTSGGGTPTGDVTVTDSASAASCTASVVTGTCDITLSTTGARTLTATYAGDANFASSTSVGAAHTAYIGIGKYDDTDPTWSYTGTWGSSTLSGPYNDTYHYSSLVNNDAQFVMFGDRFTLTYVTFASAGDLQVYVDDVLLDTISQYSASTLWQQSWTSPSLGDGVHSLKFVHATGAYASVDAIEILGPPDAVPPGDISDLNAVTGSTDGSVDLSWTAPSDNVGVSAYQVRHSTNPINDLSDWDSATSVSSGIPAPGSPGSTENMTVSSLSPGLTYHFAVRAQDPDGNLSASWNTDSATAKSPPPNGIGIYDDMHAGWAYAGSWGSSTLSGPFANTYHFSSGVTSQAQFLMDGDRFTLTYVTFASAGDLQVYVDDVLLDTISQYSASTLWQQSWTSPSLGDGVHSLKFVHATGTYASVDAIEILGPPTPPTPLGLGIYDDMEAGWEYAGSWGSGTPSGPYLNTYHFSNAVSSDAQFLMDGDRFTLTYVTFVNAGDLQVYVDDVLLDTISQYSASTLWQQSWTSPSLGDGVHSLKFVHATGTYASVDAIEILGPPTPPTPLGLGIYDDMDAGWEYSGSWGSSTLSGPYADTYHFSNAVSSDAQFLMDGDRLTLTYVTFASAGDLQVYVDDVLLDTISQYSASTLWQQSWTSPSLGEGVHSLKFVHTTGTYVSIDAIEILGPPTPPTPLGLGIYDDMDAGWEYAGSWGSSTLSGPYADTYHFSNAVSSDAQFLMNGDRFTLTYVTFASAGDLQVYVDDVLLDTISQYSASTLWQQSWTSPSLGEGVHSLKFVHTTGTYVSIDAIEILGPPTPPTPLGLGIYDDVDAGWEYTSNWTAGALSGPYDNTYHYSSATGSGAEFLMDGDRFELTYAAFSSAGDLEVYVDDVLIHTINQYSAATIWQQSWTSPSLGDGVHSLKFVHSTGTYVSIDAIEILPMP